VNAKKKPWAPIAQGWKRGVANGGREEREALLLHKRYSLNKGKVLLQERGGNSLPERPGDGRRKKRGEIVIRGKKETIVPRRGAGRKGGKAVSVVGKQRKSLHLFGLMPPLGGKKRKTRGRWTPKEGEPLRARQPKEDQGSCLYRKKGSHPGSRPKTREGHTMKKEGKRTGARETSGDRILKDLTPEAQNRKKGLSLALGKKEKGKRTN